MQIALYIIWFLLPVFFFGVGLWGKLESFGNKYRRENSGDFFRQGTFVLICCIVALVIDQFILESLVETLSPEFIPLGFYRTLLLPVILLVAALIIGPSKDIKISSRKLGSRSQSGRRS